MDYDTICLTEKNTQKETIFFYVCIEIYRSAPNIYRV